MDLQSPIEQLNDFLRIHLFETILGILAILICGVSAFIFYSTRSETFKEPVVNVAHTNTIPSKTADLLSVDISGAVNKPDVYSVRKDTRLKEVLSLAGGFSENADAGFFYRNFNLSRYLIDQEKIYIPSSEEIRLGLYTENQKIVDYTSAQSPTNNSVYSDTSDRVHINNATLDELDTLPGIGKTTAQKILDNRPFSSIDELISKKILSQNAYNKITDMISL